MAPAPTPWGLRGDPVLFDAMKDVFHVCAMPRDETQLRAAFEAAFETLTDTALADAPYVINVAWTRRGNGIQGKEWPGAPSSACR